MERLLGLVVAGMPLLFAFGFLVPVIAQSMNALGWSAPFGLSTLTFAFIAGGALGLLSMLRGSWV